MRSRFGKRAELFSGTRCAHSIYNGSTQDETKVDLRPGWDKRGLCSQFGLVSRKVLSFLGAFFGTSRREST
jgi:hypothetical protein